MRTKEIRLTGDFKHLGGFSTKYQGSIGGSGSPPPSSTGFLWQDETSNIRLSATTERRMWTIPCLMTRMMCGKMENIKALRKGTTCSAIIFFNIWCLDVFVKTCLNNQCIAWKCSNINFKPSQSKTRNPFHPVILISDPVLFLGWAGRKWPFCQPLPSRTWIIENWGLKKDDSLRHFL